MEEYFLYTEESRLEVIEEVFYYCDTGRRGMVNVSTIVKYIKGIFDRGSLGSDTVILLIELLFFNSVNSWMLKKILKKIIFKCFK